MKTVSKSVLIWYSPQEMYALVTGVEQYSQFLPWCDQARIVATQDHGMTAEIGISFSGIRQKFSTQNTHVTDRQVRMELLNGPFTTLDGEWNFLPIGDGTQRACRVELTLNYSFGNATLGKLIGPVFDKIAGSMVDAFVQRAQQVYGD